MAEDNVAIQTATATPAAGPPTLIKTFTAIDARGNLVEIQAITLVNADGRPVDIITEQTGREIVDLLKRINNLLIDPTSSPPIEIP